MYDLEFFEFIILLIHFGAKIIYFCSVPFRFPGKIFFVITIITFVFVIINLISITQKSSRS